MAGLSKGRMIRLSVAQPIAPALETIVEPLLRIGGAGNSDAEGFTDRTRNEARPILACCHRLGRCMRDFRPFIDEQHWATTYSDQLGELLPLGKQLTFWSYPSTIHPISELCHANSVA